LLRHARAGLQVPARAEVAVRAMEDGHPCLLVRIERHEALVERPGSREVDSISHLRAIQRHHRDGPEFLDVDGVFHSGITAHSARVNSVDWATEAGDQPSSAPAGLAAITMAT
jgi:hypothetical protein